jgi:hypothetical protein
MLYEVKVAVCPEFHTKQCEQHVELFIVKPGGTYSNRKALKVYWISIFGKRVSQAAV